MQHTIPIETLGPQGPSMANAVEKCVHCGFCLSACPTYAVLGEEMDSPRGRITLMKSALEGTLSIEQTLPYIDRCLGCLACEPACPSGVPYGELLMPYRALAEEQRTRGPVDSLSRTLTRETLPYPGRFRLAAASGRLARPLKRFLPAKLGAMITLLPEDVPAAAPLPAIYPAIGPRRARVALLAGCVQQVLAPEINWATLRVLAYNGVEVVIPREQGCCGSLMMHTGDAADARRLARRNLNVFPTDVDAVLTNAAGCGSGMHEYGLLFKGEPDEAAAEALAARTQDVTVFLDALGLIPPPPLPRPLRVAYHDACHLAHAQLVKTPPRRLLRAIPNLELLEVPEGDLCCGSAGTYNLEQPAIAAALGQRKAENIQRTRPDAVAAGNIGCLVQIKSSLKAINGEMLPLYHTLQLLDMAYSSINP
jgi:glycolate oxidase iron-sulfur subunit